jgi:hypothetical protein
MSDIELAEPMMDRHPLMGVVLLQIGRAKIVR